MKLMGGYMFLMLPTQFMFLIISRFIHHNVDVEHIFTGFNTLIVIGFQSCDIHDFIFMTHAQ